MAITGSRADVGVSAPPSFVEAVTALRGRVGGGDLLAVLCVALDDLPALRAERGPAVTDLVVQATIEHLRACAPGAAVGRIADDELAVAFLGDDDVARHLSLEVARPVPIEIDGAPLTMSLSVGLAFDNPAHDPVQSVRRADERLCAHRRARGPGRR